MAASNKELAERVRAKVKGEGASLSGALEAVVPSDPKKREAVRKALQRAGGCGKLQGRRRLNDEQEKTLMLVCLGFAQAHYPLNASLAQLAVQELYGFTPKKRWVRRFVRRHDELHVRQSKYLKEARAAPRLVPEVELFISTVEKYIHEFGLDPTAVVNCDETILKLSSGGELVVDKGGSRESGAHGACSVLGSLLPFVVADGSVVATFWVQHGAFGLRAGGEGGEEEEAEVQLVAPTGKLAGRGAWPRFFVFSETGYVNGDVYEACVRRFVEVWHGKHPGKRVYLFADQLAFHKRISLVGWALRQRVELWFLPANSSHFTQPLDDAPFAVLKRKMHGKAYEAKLVSSFAHIPQRTSFLSYAFEAEQCSLVPHVIRAGFKNTGLVPWRPDILRQQARANAGACGTEGADDLIQRATNAAAEVVRALGASGAGKGGRPGGGRGEAQGAQTKA